MLLSLPAHPSCSTPSSASAIERRRCASSLHQLGGHGRNCRSTTSASPFLEGARHGARLPAGWTPRRWPSVAARVAAPFPHELLRHPPPSVDPAPTTAAEQLLVRSISSPGEFQQYLERNSGKLVVLMCKARSCRPCKAFAKRYQTIAKTYPDSVFLDVHGDDTMDLRGMMMKMQIKATPSFRLFRGGEQVGALTGANANKLSDAIQANLRPGESGFVERFEPEPEPASAESS